jgi:hypothetical protein
MQNGRRMFGLFSHLESCIQDCSYDIIFIKDDCRQALVGLPGFLTWNPGNCQSAMQPQI